LLGSGLRLDDKIYVLKIGWVLGKKRTDTIPKNHISLIGLFDLIVGLTNTINKKTRVYMQGFVVVNCLRMQKYVALFVNFIDLG
jgi:hypothetical protein